MRILLIEDNKELCEAIEAHFKKDGYQLDICYDGNDAAYYISGFAHDVIILDRMLPGIDGLTILERIRSRGILTPVIMITALDGINDRIDGLDGGADDYLVKPFDVKELQARVQALLRRPRTIKASDSLSYSDITYNMNTFTLQKDDKSITLSRKEGALLECLMKHKEQVLTRDQILNMVWGMDSFVEDGNIDNYIFFLRRRLKALNSKAAIKTVHGVGYKLENTDYA